MLAAIIRALGLGAALWLLAVSGCHSGGPYGHSKVYAPTGDEERAIAAAKEYDPVMAQRTPEQWRKKPVSLFGVVTNRGSGPGGAAYVALSVRALEPRNLCESDDEDSCRVAVSDREYARIHVLLNLVADDDLGEHSVGMSSLLRVAGTIGEDIDPIDGTPILRASFYRHWPRGFFVTAKAAAVMRR
jgi:hypothetical protein